MPPGEAGSGHMAADASRCYFPKQTGLVLPHQSSVQLRPAAMRIIAAASWQNMAVNAPLLGPKTWTCITYSR